MYLNDQGKDYKGKVKNSYSYKFSINYVIGFLDGIWAYAYMKDGIYYVGTTGITLEQANINFVRDNWPMFPQETKEWLKIDYLPIVKKAKVI